MNTQDRELETAEEAPVGVVLSPVRDVESSYAYCREVARREAKNFYYSFVALPSHKRNAICAVYAFMRKADDLSDDEEKSHAQRRIELAEWVASWHRAEQVQYPGSGIDDPIFPALLDAKARFHISSQLLDQLIAGTAMDLDRPAFMEGAFDTYATFADLYQYCYLVASVVGLVCIRIFGYEDEQAEKLAEQTGIAFQLTNILRDVREDAERQRIYLPLDQLARYDVTPAEIVGLAKGGLLQQRHRAMLAETAQHAEDFYKSAQILLKLIHPDSRAALWVLVTIYHRLLLRIEAADYDVFSQRLSVPTYEKVGLLLQGIVMVYWNRAVSWFARLFGSRRA
jgi:phytoene synthase